MEKRRHYTTSNIAGFSYWDGCIVFTELKIGTILSLQREADKFDPYAVAIYYGEYKLGFVPRGENHELSKFIELGYADMFEVRINRISSDQHPENQVGVIIYIKGKEE